MSAQLSDHKEVLRLMGTRFELTAIGESQAQAAYAVQKGIEEIQRIEAMISSWQADSQTSKINQAAGQQAVEVDQELFDLIQRSIKVSNLTQGAFDISFAGIEKLYEFDRAEKELPVEEELQNSIAKINYENILLDPENKTVFLKKEGMRIGFGAIGKGYAANKAMMVMKQLEGIKGGLVNASGDLIAWGESGKKNGWPIQISDPKDINKTLGWLNIQNSSIVTSGDYEKYFTNNGKRYAHIINPKTGLPTTGIKSVSIICADAELGDALATSVFVLGEVAGIHLINRLKNVEALIVNDEDDLISSKNLKLNKY